MKAFDGCFLDRAIHPLDLAIRPRMPHLREAVLNPVLATNVVEDVCKGVRIQAAVGELNAVVGQHGVDPIGQRVQQLAPCPPHDRGVARPPPPPPPSNEPRRAHTEGVPQPVEAGPNPEQSCLLAEENSGGAGHTPSLAARQRSLDPRLMLRRFESAGAVFFASVDKFLDLTAFKTVGVAGEFLLDQLHQEVER